MNIILLSGGSGKRLWPLSNDVRSKQFIKIFRRPDGEYESMVQRVYRQLKAVDPYCTVTIATARSQIPAILNHLGKNVQISLEPCRRDTFPAIVLATAFLHDVMGISEEEPVVVCPVDPYVESGYFETLKILEAQARKEEANLVLMGIEPTYPSERYGYIIPSDREKISSVKMFQEKPDKETAKEYLAQGALWNGGVFAYKLKYVLNRAREMLNYTNYQDLYNRYDQLPKISFDYAVVEKEPFIQVIRYHGEWRDVGTWNTMVDSMYNKSIGPVIMDGECENVYVINELEVPVLAMGLKNMIVCASPQGILVTEKHASANIKPFVDKIDETARFAEKAWGNFKVLDVGEGSKTLRLKMTPGGTFRYHRHQYRDESWTVVYGTGEAIVDGRIIPLHPGTVVELPRGCMHNLVAKTNMIIIEVMCGEKILEEDYIKYAKE
ncbi:MAG: cupin domain-containing protein [Clostridia bacterium]|nr:cupin domain-containing protein [Clostridia bacterium]